MKESLCQNGHKFWSKLKWRQIAVISKLYTKIHNVVKMPYKYLVNIPQTLPLPFISLMLNTKRVWKCDQKKNLRQNTVCLVNKFTPAQTILHNRWLWWLRHLEGLALPYSDETYSLMRPRLQLEWTQIDIISLLCFGRFEGEKDNWEAPHLLSHLLL